MLRTLKNKNQIMLLSYNNNKLNTKKFKGLYVTLFILFYLFNFSLGVERINIFIKYAYIYSTVLAIYFLFRVTFSKKILIDKRFLFLFITIQLFTIIFCLLNGILFSSIVNAGHQIMFLIIFGGIFILYDFNRINFAQFFCNVIIIVTTLSLIFAFWGFLFGSFSFGPFIYQSFQGYVFRLDGWYSSANYLGPAIAIGAIVLLFKLLNKYLFALTFRHKIWLIVLFIFHVIGIILTGSRGSYGSFLIGILVFLFFQKDLIKIRIKYILYSLIIISLSLFAIIYVMTELGYDWTKIETDFIRYDQLERYKEGGERVYLWTKAFEFLTQANIFHFLFGHGIGFYREKMYIAAHSGYIELFIGRGMLIFFLFLYLLYYSLKKSIKINDEYNIGTLTISLLFLIMAKNVVNAEIPTNTFPGIVFIFILVLLFFKPSKANNFN